MRTKSITKKDIAPRINCIAPWRLTGVKPLPNHRLEVTFVDGLRGFVEMVSKIMSEKAGVFKKLREISYFNQVHLEYGVVTWPDEIDLAPDAMYDEIKRNGVWVLE